MVVRVGSSSPWLAAREERGEDKIEQECAAREEDKVGGKRGQAPQGHASSEGGGLREEKISRSKVNVFHIYRQGEG